METESLLLSILPAFSHVRNSLGVVLLLHEKRLEVSVINLKGY